MVNPASLIGHPMVLALFSPSDDDRPKGKRPRAYGGLSASMPLSAFYAAYVLPVVRATASPKTIELDRTALSLWSALVGDPPIGEITDDLAALFVARMAARKGRRGSVSPWTIRKLCSHLQKILDLAGPRDRHQRQAAGLLGWTPPYIERPKARTSAPVDVWTLQEIAAAVEACAHAKQTANLGTIPAVRFWRSLFLFAYNTGMRIQSILGATWSMLDHDRRDWLTIPPEIAKQGRGGLVYVNTAARAAIDTLGTRGLRGAIFPWDGWPESAPWLHACRRSILAASTIAPHRRYGFHALRKALGTWLASHNPMVASIVLWHRGGVTQTHYVDPSIVVDLLERVPQPATDSQGRLF